MSTDPAAAKALFLEAVAIEDPVTRAALVGERCGDDAELLARVNALLAANDRALAGAGTASFGGADGGDAAEPTADHPGKGEQAGAVIGGKYALVEPIGEGGMGAVWRAKQTEPVKRFVAVKLIKAGMDSRRVLARFEAERQALALMDHPNIARVLDGGLHEGRPFFVMELVKGVSITEYCDRHRLTPRERLRLFVPVCQAIQHAHQKGVIHRDIKPSNVLVALYDDRPVVKVIDFGVAKATGGALTQATIDTGFGGVVGTPQYMSPEQATFNNLDIDTRSDVYALGVLLYELLTGSPPFAREELEKRGLLEILRVVREEEPPRPSARLSTSDALPTLSANRGTEPKKLTGLLRSELDWVVMKALEKDRARRYDSANAFASDVLRYLDSEAVRAHPPSAAYRLRKFVRRNRGRVIAAGLVLFALVAGVVGTTVGLIRAEAARRGEVAQRQLAEENERLAREAAADAVRAGGRAKASEARAKLALDNADKLLAIQERFRPRGNDRYSPDQLATLQGLAAQFEEVAKGGAGPRAAEAFARLATVQRLLDKPAEQTKSLECSLQLWADLIRTDPANAKESRVQVAKARRRLAGEFDKFPPDPKYIALLRQTAADWKAVTDGDPENTDALSERSIVLQELASCVAFSDGSPPVAPPAAVAEQAALRREAVECAAKAVALRPYDRALHKRLRAAYQYAGLFAEAVRADLRAATRFPDEAAENGYFWMIDHPFGYLVREKETWDTLALERIEITTNRAVVGEVLKEFPGYRYASGAELLLKIGEAKAQVAPPPAELKPGEKAPAPTAEQLRRRAELFREALALARKPETKLPAEFLKLIYEEGGYDPFAKRPPRQTAPITAEEYVWLRRLYSNWDEANEADEAELAELKDELARRKDWRPTAMFQYRLAMALLPEGLAEDPGTPKDKLTARWLLADELFVHFRASAPRDDGYREAATQFSGTAVSCASRFLAWGERGHAKAALTRCIELLEETPPRPDVQDWPYRCRCYFDRGNLHLDLGEWAAALADYQSCLSLSEQKPGQYDSLSIPGMNAVAHFRSGTALLRLGRFDEADEAFDEAIRFRRAETFQSRPLKSGKASAPWTVPVTQRDRANEYRLVGRWGPGRDWANRALKTLAENEEAYPVEQVNRLRYSLHSIRAQALEGLKAYAAAAEAWDAARRFATAEQLREFAVTSASAYARAGRQEEAARRLDELGPADKLTAIEAYNAGCGFAHCSLGAKVDKELAARHRDRAMALLRAAVTAGYSNAGEMKADPDLVPLRDRDDFKALLAELESKAKMK